MTNKEFCIQLEKRTKLFAINILKLTACIPYTPESKVIRHQLSKSGTSVGANYREANRARSIRDFKHKITICESEASESCYWLDIIEEMKWLTPITIMPVLKESNELLAIFTSIGTSLDKKTKLKQQTLNTLGTQDTQDTQGTLNTLDTLDTQGTLGTLDTLDT